MDEPFGAVDPVVRTQLQDELLRLQKELNKTIVFVTHDIDEAVRLGDRIAIFRTGGHLVQCAAPAELLARPADDFVADFLGAERGLKLLSLKTLAEVPQGPAPEGDTWTLVVDEARKPLHWAAKDAEIPVRPLTDGDSLLAALNESVASPNGLIARVDAAGVLTGVSSRDDIHTHAGQAHAEARVAA
jgi:osmoprotectant transport system ATP-binding protein